MASVKTNGVKMAFTGADGNTFSKTLNGFNTDTVNDAESAATFARQYSKIVDGTLKSASLIETTPVDVDAD